MVGERLEMRFDQVPDEDQARALHGVDQLLRKSLFKIRPTYGTHRYLVLDESALSPTTVGVIDRREAAGFRIPIAAHVRGTGTKAETVVVWDDAHRPEPQRGSRMARLLREAPEDFHWRDDAELVAATVEIKTPDVEIRLITAAKAIAASIVEAPVWSQDVLAPHRSVFDPAQEVGRIARTANAVAVMRSRLPGRPQAGLSALLQQSGLAEKANALGGGRAKGLLARLAAAEQSRGTDEEQMARTHAEREHGSLDALVDGIKRRVASLWLYADQVQELGRKAAALAEVEAALARAPQLDALARRIGDDAAVEEIQRMTFEAQALSSDLTGLTTAMRGMLGPSGT